MKTILPRILRAFRELEAQADDREREAIKMLDELSDDLRRRREAAAGGTKSGLHVVPELDPSILFMNHSETAPSGLIRRADGSIVNRACLRSLEGRK